MRCPHRLILVLTMAAVLIACQTVPYTGRHHLLLVSQSEEAQLGLQSYEDVLKKSKLSNDHENLDMIRRVGNRLAKAADRPDFRWEFNLIKEDKTINAFCLPGGKVAVYTGILPAAQGENGIAVVLGHEISHALARHGAERMSQGMLANFGGQALGLLLAKQPGAMRDLYGQAYGLGVGLGVLLPYSRTQESEADHIGLILMAKAGYDPAQALLFWKRMAKATEDKDSSSALTNFLRTHPTNEKRIRQIEDWLPEVRAQYYKPRTGESAPTGLAQDKPGEAGENVEKKEQE